MSEDIKDGMRRAHRFALDRERNAWLKLATLKIGSSRRSEEFEEWLAAAREAREAQARLTDIAVREATASMKECIDMLTRPSDVPGAPQRVSALHADTIRTVPVEGQRFRGRDGALWQVVSVTPDALEPGYWLAQLEKQGRGDDDTCDVYSEDWPLFCVANGLEPIGARRDGGN